MFDNRWIASVSWKFGHLQNLAVLTKRSNDVGSRFSSALLKSRISSGLSQLSYSSTSRCDFLKNTIFISASLNSRLCRITPSRGFIRVNWVVPITAEFIKIKKENAKSWEYHLGRSFMRGCISLRMEHTIASGTAILKSHKRQHSVDASDNGKQLKTDEAQNATGAEGGTKSRNRINPGGGVVASSDNGPVNHATRSREQIICNRPWEITSKGKTFYSSYGDLSHTVYEFSIASYNVLAQNLLTENGYLYHNCESKYLKWNFRKTLLLNELRKHSPDILCFQEVNEDHYQDFFQPELESLGYSGAYKKRTGTRKDGCATFYKKDKFDCQLIYPVEYLMPEVALLDRDNVALVLLLHPKKL